jgi:hypothetical protein
MKRAVLLVALAVWLTGAGVMAPGAAARAADADANQDAQRDATREKLRATLERVGPKIGVAFRQSAKNPYNFIGSMTQGLKNSDSLEIVISVTKVQTVGFRVYPHYAGGYINYGRVKDSAEFARRLLRLSDENFLFWGIDDTVDTFSGYTITLESGYPDESVAIVLSSIANTDKFVGELRPSIDGSSPAP